MLGEGPAALILVRYRKMLHDQPSGETSRAVTWERVGLFPVGGSSGIMQSLSEALDAFIGDYLRVNEESC